VPLIIRGPGVKPGTRLAGVARTIDLFPTVLDMTGLGAAMQSSSGHSLAAALSGGTMPDEPSFAESLVPLLHYGWSDLRAVRDGRWKYILAPRPELYDLERDPGELQNLVSTEPQRAAAMHSAVEQRLLTETEHGTGKGPATAGVPRDVRERLGALGYVNPGGARGKPGSGADPKDKLAEYKALSTGMQDALVALRTGRSGEAVQHLRKVAAAGLDSYEVHYYLGRAYAAQQKWREAAAEYEKATGKLPGDMEAWRGLGESRVALGDTGGAVRAFEKLVALAPADAVAQMQLGEAYRDQGRWSEATRAIRAALAIDPSPAQYWNSLGTVLAGGGTMAEAERGFAEAVSREPNNPLYIYNHGLALQQLGRRGEAAADFQRAAALGYAPGTGTRR
jgi:tetratricopeptide (TPR) repeat protein